METIPCFTEDYVTLALNQAGLNRPQFSSLRVPRCLRLITSLPPLFSRPYNINLNPFSSLPRSSLDLIPSLFHPVFPSFPFLLYSHHPPPPSSLLSSPSFYPLILFLSFPISPSSYPIAFLLVFLYSYPPILSYSYLFLSFLCSASSLPSCPVYLFLPLSSLYLPPSSPHFPYIPRLPSTPSLISH